MKMIKDLTAFILCGVGALVAVGSWPAQGVVDSQSVALRPKPSAVKPKLLNCPQASKTADLLVELRSRVADREQVLQVAISQEELVSGHPMRWPVDLQPELSELYIEARLLEILGGECTTVRLDCSEYPCVAVIAWCVERNQEMKDAPSAIAAAWPASVDFSEVVWFQDGEVAAEGHVLAFPGTGLTSEERRRVRFRCEEFDERENGSIREQFTTQ